MEAYTVDILKMGTCMGRAYLNGKVAVDTLANIMKVNGTGKALIPGLTGPSTRVTIKPEFVREKASLISRMANATRDISSQGNDKAKVYYTIQPGRWTGDFGRMTSW